MEDENDNYGIDKDKAHQRARELVPDEFFWDCADELAPFGSDEGDTALAEFRDWRRENPKAPVLDCLKWTIESVGEMDFAKYDDTLLADALIQEQIEDDEFDDQQYIFTLDVSVIATGFGQLVDEGKIDPTAKPVIRRAIDRQSAWARLRPDWSFSAEYRDKLDVLGRILEKA
jgi:uncharacterized protein YfeS